MTTVSRRRRAFTLVELLVVIGIIGALIAILLPVLSGVQARGRDIKCQSNLRQIVQAMLGYAAENNAQLPYGFYWNRSNPTDWSEAGDNAGSSGDPQNTHPFLSWASLVGKYMGKRLNGDNDDTNFPPVLRCPEADLYTPHVVSYVTNMIVNVNPQAEFQVGSAPNAQSRPTKLTQLRKSETAIIWDTAIQEDSENSVGFLSGVDIDNQRFWRGAQSPQFRYYSDADPFGYIPPGVSGNNKPVNMGAGWLNTDRPADPANDGDIPYQGNLRFRHNKGTACNVGFSDGHVGQFIAKTNGDKSMKSHDALRRYFMIKPPNGIIPDPSLPGG